MRTRRQMTAAIKQAAAIHGQPLSVFTYATHRQPTDPGLDEILTCFATWEEACAEARVAAA